ncbi:MAG: hypothetical protein ACRC41_08835 [Sarcina sp.]
MKSCLRWMLVILAVILIFLKYLYRGNVDFSMVMFLAITLFPLLIIANFIQIFFSGTQNVGLRVFSVFIALGLGFVTTFIMVFAYCWDFEDIIKEEKYQRYDISKDITLEFEIVEAIRSKNKNVTFFVKDKDEKIKIATFDTKLDLNIKFDKLKTIGEHDLYIIKYEHCYDVKDSKYREAIFPLIINKEGQVPYIKNNEIFENYGLMSEFNMLRYLEDDKLKQDICLDQIENFTSVEFFAYACNNLFENKEMQEMILKNISTNLANGKIPIEEFKYEFSKEILTAYNSELS